MEPAYTSMLPKTLVGSQTRKYIRSRPRHGYELGDEYLYCCQNLLIRSCDLHVINTYIIGNVELRWGGGNRKQLVEDSRNDLKGGDKKNLRWSSHLEFLHIYAISMIRLQIGSRIPKWRLFVSDTGSSNISAVDWDIASKFGLQINFYILLRMLSLYPKQKWMSDAMAVILKRNQYDVITPPCIVWFG